MENETVPAKDTTSFGAEYIEPLLGAFWVQIPCWIQILFQNNLGITHFGYVRYLLYL